PSMPPRTPAPATFASRTRSWLASTPPSPAVAAPRSCRPCERRPPRLRRGEPGSRGFARLQHRRHEGADVDAAVVPDAVDVERRRAVDAAAHAADEILADASRVHAARELAHEALDGPALRHVVGDP